MDALERDDMENLIEAVKAVNENNEMNGARWADWSGADHVAEVYGIELRDDEAEIIDRAIETDGASLLADLMRAERIEYGQNFFGSSAEIEGMKAGAR